MRRRDAIEPCPWCGARVQPVAVHGHGQCSACGGNVAPCCDGASPGDEARRTAEDRLTADPGLFARLFERLGGSDATVTTDALLFALVDSQDTDLEGARLIVQAGAHTGRLATAGHECYRLSHPPRP